jgi:hypothetical protein
VSGAVKVSSAAAGAIDALSVQAPAGFTGSLIYGQVDATTAVTSNLLLLQRGAVDVFQVTSMFSLPSAAGYGINACDRVGRCRSGA